MDIIAKDAVGTLTREMINGKAVIFRRPLTGNEANHELMDLFRHESEAMAGMSLPTMLRYDEWLDGAWAMKLSTGFISMYDVLTTNPGVLCSPTAVLSIARQLVTHLNYLHRHGQFMVQLCPHNVLVNPSTLQIKVMPPLSAYTVLKTNIFAHQKGVAPEVIESALAVNNRSDLYAFSQLLGTMQQFAPLPYPLRAAYSLCSNPAPAQRPGNCTEVLRLMDEAGQRSKYMPYICGVLLFAGVFGMFLYSTLTSNDSAPQGTKYIEPEKRKPSPEGVPDSINLIIEQYHQYLKDSVMMDDSLQYEGM